VKPSKEIPVARPEWLWTWDGDCFGYRMGNSLFTHDGMEVGRFSGVEVYGIDGSYLGELGSTEDGSRLVTNLYKKSRVSSGFTPTFDHAFYERPRNRVKQSLYCGHENFPSVEQAKTLA